MKHTLQDIGVVVALKAIDIVEPVAGKAEETIKKIRRPQGLHYKKK